MAICVDISLVKAVYEKVSWDLVEYEYEIDPVI